MLYFALGNPPFTFSNSSIDSIVYVRLMSSMGTRKGFAKSKKETSGWDLDKVSNYFGGLRILIYLCSGNINVFNHETNSVDDDRDAELVHVRAGWQRK
jgi:hypothetical protein